MHRLTLLGPVTVVIDGTPRIVTAPKQRAVLAHLALEPGVPQSADRLLEAVWGDDQPSGGAKAVAFQITKLRDALEPDRQGEGTIISTSSAGYVLQLSPRQIDVHDVAATLDDASNALTEDASKARQLAEDALAMWRGAPFADVPASFVIDEESLRLDLLHTRAQAILFEARLTLGEHASVVADIARFVERHPLDEGATDLLMRALDGCGRTAEALRAFGALRTRLVEELGIDPAPHLVALESALLTKSDPPPQATAVPTPSNGLPQPVTSLIGREGEVDEVVALVDDQDCRVLSLLGPGGIGKTRLAIAVAQAWQQATGQATRYVGLAALDGDEITDLVAGAVDFVIDQHIIGNGLDGRTQLLDYLSLQPGLLVLDNFEHLIHHADFVADVAERCPDLTVLVTSRERLAITAEWVHEVPGLTTVGPDAAARRLFVTRAHQAGARLSAEDREQIGRLCEATDGLPLALELAAASTPVMGVAAIAERLETKAASLSTPAVDVDPRHQTLRAAFDHSWQLLDDPARRHLSQLAVFSAPFTPEAAEAVVGAGVSSMARLLMKSLIRRTEAGRFDLHPMIRQFALAELGDDETSTRRAHAHCYVDWLHPRTASLLGGPDQMATAQLVDADIEHIKAAGSWLAGNVTQDDHDARLCRLLHGLSAYWFIRSIDAWSTTVTSIADAIEGSLGADAALDSPAYLWARAYHNYPDAMLESDHVADSMHAVMPSVRELDDQAYAWCLMNLAIRSELDGDIEAALALMEQAAQFPCDDQPLLHAAITSWHGWELNLLGRHEEAGEVWKRGLEHAERHQNLTARAYMLSKVGLHADDVGDTDLALQCHRESAAVFEATGDQGGLGYTLSRLSWTLRIQGNFTDAINQADAALEQFRRINHRWGIGASLGRKAHAQLDAGDHAGAATSFRQCLDWGEETAMPSITWYGLVGVGATLAAVGDDARAARLLVHNTTIAQNPYIPVMARPALETVQPRLSEADFADAAARGEAMSMADAVRLARLGADEIAADD